MVVARGGLPADARSTAQIPASMSDGSCGTSTQRVCYRAPLARGCVEGSSSSFPAVLWRRWSLEVVAVEVVGLEDLWGFLRKSAVL